MGRLALLTALVAFGLWLTRFPVSWVVAGAFLAAVIVGPYVLARKGYTLVEVAIVLAILLLAAGLLVPAMQRTRFRTLGRRTIPVVMPDSVRRFVEGFQ
jgi:prepilin-type N-terminal cleavage/methylation domain-containing protein